MKKTYKTLRPLLIGLLTFTVIAQGLLIYQEQRKNQAQQEKFLNSFYNELNAAISDFENVSSSDEGYGLSYKLNQIDKSLTRTGHVIESGHLFFNSDLIHSSLEMFFYHQPIMEFAKDGSLSNAEKSKLTNIQNKLEKLKDDLNEDGKVNKKMSIEAFNEAIQENQTLYKN